MRAHLYVYICVLLYCPRIKNKTKLNRLEPSLSAGILLFVWLPSHLKDIELSIVNIVICLILEKTKIWCRPFIAFGIKQNQWNITKQLDFYLVQIIFLSFSFFFFVFFIFWFCSSVALMPRATRIFNNNKKFKEKNTQFKMTFCVV